MWSLILFIGACSALSVEEHWRQVSEHGIALRRGIYGINIKENTLWNIAPMAVASEPGRIIDLFNLNIKEIRSNVFDDLANVTVLNLANNELENIPPLIFGKLKTLETLSLADNKLRTFDRCFVGLRNLKSLDLSNNLIESLTPGDLLGLPKTVSLTVAGNPLKKFAINYGNQSLPYYVPSESNGNPWSSLIKSDLKPVVEIWEDLKNVPADSSYGPAWLSYKSKPLYIKLCETKDGMVKSLKLAADEKASEDYQTIFPQRYSLNLNLNDRGIIQFERKWYRIFEDLFETINLSSNKIIRIKQSLLNALPPSIVSLRLDKNQIRKIRTNIIHNEFLKKISFEYNKIEIIEDGAFEGTKLVSISFAHNNLKDNLNFTKTLPISVKELILSWNNITQISEDFLVNLKGLEYLKLGWNNISYLPLKTFRGLKELRLIDLSYNLLKTIEPGTFEDQAKLSLLRLSYNNIKEITPGIFNGLKNIRTVLLTGNDITRITKDSFLGLKNLILRTMTLSKNFIDTIEKGSFSHMTIHQLYLNSNNISEKSVEKGAFDLCTLYELIYYSNPIASISGDSFKGLLLYIEKRFPF